MALFTPNIKQNSEKKGEFLSVIQNEIDLFKLINYFNFHVFFEESEI